MVSTEYVTPFTHYLVLSCPHVDKRTHGHPPFASLLHSASFKVSRVWRIAVSCVVDVVRPLNWNDFIKMNNHSPSVYRYT